MTPAASISLVACAGIAVAGAAWPFVAHRSRAHPSGRGSRSLVWAAIAALAISAIALPALDAVGASGSRKADPTPAGVASAEMRLGLDALQRGSLTDARRAFEAILVRAPADRAARTQLGLTLYLSGRPKAGLEQVDRVLRLDQRYAPARLVRALILLRGFGRASRAAADLRAFLGSNPDADARAMAERLLRQAREAVA